MPGLVWDLIAKDGASPAFLRVAGAADKAAASTERATKGVESSAARMGAVGAKLTKSVTLPIAAIAAASVNMAAHFQQSTNVLVTAAGESAANLGKVRKGILDVAQSTGTGWKDVTAAVYVAEKAGYRGANAITLVRAAAQGAREEGAQLSTVLNAQTSIMASYHMPASKSVQVINEMKTAAGEAKTTMEQFAGSLSTVLPVASANKISFADVAGTLASLTQHGTSADEAAQELAFTMRGLAAPSMVAVKEMAQLGISGIDVSKRLGDGPGGRGLAGTLNYLSQTVLKRMGPSGKVLLSTFNASKVAAHDAAVEYNALAPATQKLAKAYIDGTIKQGDWTKGVKALTPEQANLAKQFAVTENSARGFQAAIRSGVNGSQTYSDAIKKMTGGANGLNVVLQATGASTAGTTERIKRIADAALGAGKNVSGWSSTQKLFSVQLDMFKQKMAAAGIQIGTVLLPALTSVVKAVSGAAQWFGNLTGGQQKLLVWAAVGAAAIGPMLSIFSRLAGVLRFLPGLFLEASTSAGGMATTTGAAMRGVGLALSGLQVAAAGYFGGSYVAGKAADHLGGSRGSASSSSSDRFRSATGTVLAGAAGGTAVGAAFGSFLPGPGTVIGGVVGGLSGTVAGVVTAFSHMNDAAKAAQKAAVAALLAQKAAASDLLGVLQSVGGAYNDQYKVNVTQKLDSSGALSIGNQAGLKPGQLTNAVIGAGGPKALAAMNVQIENAYAAGKITLPQMNKLQGVIAKLAPAATTAEAALERQNREMGKGVLAADQVGVSYGKLRAALVGNALDGQTAAGKRNNAVLKQNVTALDAAAAAQIRAKVPADKVAKSYLSQIDALQANSAKLHLNAGDVEALIAKYAKVPPSVITAMRQQGIATITPALLGLLQLYDRTPRTITTNFEANISPALQRASNLLNNMPGSSTFRTTNAASSPQRAFAQGGTIPPNTRFTVGEAGWEGGVTDSMGRASIFSNAQSKALGFKAPTAYASGTGASLMAAIQAAGFRGNAAAIMYGIVMAESGGNARAHNGNAGTGDNSYGLAQINMLGSMGPARRAQYGLSSNSQLYDPATNLRIAYAMSGHGTHFGDWSTYNSGAYRAAMGQTGATIRNGGGFTVPGSGGLSVASLANLRIKLNRQDLDRLRNSLKSTAYSVRTAFNTIFSDMTRVGAPGSVTSMLQGIETRVLAIQSKVAKANTLWTSMATYRQGVATTLDGFDPTKAGSVADLVAGYGGATSKNMAYTSELNKLRAKTKGNSVLTGLVNTLAASGQTATLQTLAGASSGQLAQVAKSVGAYDSSVWAGADAATAEKFGGNTLAQQTRNVNKLTSEMNGFVQVVAQLAHEVGRQTITVSIDGEKHAAKVTNSKAMQHLLAELEHIIAKGH